MKICRSCKIIKSARDFHSAPRNLDGMASFCKKCIIIRYEKDLSKITIRLENLEQNYNRNGVCGKICSECKIDKPLTDFSPNKNGLYGKQSKCRSCHTKKYDNSDNRKKYKKEWQIKNKDIANEATKRWRNRNPDKAKSSKRIWAKNNPDKVRLHKLAHKHKRRLLLNDGRRNDLTSKQIEALLLQYPACMLCDSSKDITIEHFVPITRGGENTLDNVGVFCNSCNGTKGNRNICEFMWRLVGKNDRRIMSL